MSASQIIDQCKVLGISLATKEGGLRLEAPEGVVTPPLLASIRQNKQQIIKALTDTEGQYDNLLEAFEERAAIMEYEGGLNRKEAEHQAALLTGYQHVYQANPC